MQWYFEERNGGVAILNKSNNTYMGVLGNLILPLKAIVSVQTDDPTIFILHPVEGDVNGAFTYVAFIPIAEDCHSCPPYAGFSSKIRTMLSTSPVVLEFQGPRSSPGMLTTG